MFVFNNFMDVITVRTRSRYHGTVGSYERGSPQSYIQGGSTDRQTHRRRNQSTEVRTQIPSIFLKKHYFSLVHQLVALHEIVTRNIAYGNANQDIYIMLFSIFASNQSNCWRQKGLHTINIGQVTTKSATWSLLWSAFKVAFSIVEYQSLNVHQWK